jgi:arginyl-tRNA synthetase
MITGMLAVGYARYGSEERLQTDPIRHLYEVYVAINKDAKDEAKGTEVHDEARRYFKRMEEGDEEALALWKRFRDLRFGKTPSSVKT